MKTRLLSSVCLLLLCLSWTFAQHGNRMTWYSLTMGFSSVKSSTGILQGVLGQSFTGTMRSGNIVLSAGFLADTLLRRIVVSTQEGQATPGAFVLYQNYPNPFNPATTIRYGMPARSRVTIAVFNILGEEVAQLVNGEQESGYHEMRFDGRNLSSGVYFCRMRAGDVVQMQKLLLVK
jgi:hypothetical protein